MSLLAQFYNTPWALEPYTLHAIQMVVERWSAGVRLSPDEISAAIGPAPQALADRRAAAQQQSGGGGVYVLPVYGVLTHRAVDAQQVSTTLSSTEVLSAQLRSLVADAGVSAIVMDFNSPGGSVFGVQELADTIHGLRGSKPIVGIANATAASGGYWALSQCDEVVVTPSGQVGSIGVMMAHQDLSGAMEKAGIKVEYVFSGENKVEGNPTGPLSDATRAHLQGKSDSYYAAFTKSLARGRNQPMDVVRSQEWGRGRMLLAAEAVKAGMADRIETLEATVARLAKPQGRRAAMSASSLAHRIQVLQATSPIEV